MDAIEKKAPHVLSIVSGKGGVGKTTVTSNLGILLASEFGKRVLVIDGNISTANLGIHLGFIKCPVSFQDVIDKTIKTYQAVYVHKSGLNIIPASLSMEHEQHDYPANLLSKRIQKIVSDVKGHYDIVLIDGAAGISGEAKAAISASESVLAITVPEIPTVTAAIKVVETANELKVPVFGIVMNRVRGGKVEVSKDEIERLCKAKVICIVPEDEAVRESTSHREPVSVIRPNSASVKELRKLAGRIVLASEGKAEEGPAPKPKGKGFFGLFGKKRAAPENLLLSQGNDKKAQGAPAPSPGTQKEGGRPLEKDAKEGRQAKADPKKDKETSRKTDETDGKKGRGFWFFGRKK